MTQRFPRLAVLALLLLPGALHAQNQGEAPPPASGVQQQVAWSGTWTGWGDQGDSQWSIDIVFQPDGNATIDYASIPCSGELSLLKDGGQQRVFRESIIVNTANCVNDGFVMLTLVDDSTLDFAWEGAGMQAGGSLRRVGSP